MKKVLSLVLVSVFGVLFYGCKKAKDKFPINHTGEMKFALNADGKSYYLDSYIGHDKFVAIPKEYRGYPVTAIGPEAFKNNPRVKRIFISNKITEIENNAFVETDNLESIEFEEESKLEIIGKRAFYGTSLKSITIPKSVKTISAEAFMNSSIELVQFDLSSSLKTIGAKAFTGAKIVKIVIPKEVETIEERAFTNSSIKTVMFENDSKLKEICKCAFQDTLLERIVIPDSVVKISDNAFNKCDIFVYVSKDKKPSGWEPNWNAYMCENDTCEYSNVYWLGEWDYDINQIPKPTRLE